MLMTLYLANISLELHKLVLGGTLYLVFPNYRFFQNDGFRFGFLKKTGFRFRFSVFFQAEKAAQNEETEAQCACF